MRERKRGETKREKKVMREERGRKEEKRERKEESVLVWIVERSKIMLNCVLTQENMILICIIVNNEAVL